METEADYLAHLDPALDVILAEYTLPQFDAPRALHLLQERGLGIPFIIVTGMASEEAVVECMRQGAADYLFKDRLARLGTAVKHALAQARLRQEKAQAEEDWRRSEERYRSIVENAVEGIIQSTPEGRFLSANPALACMMGYESPGEMMASVTDIGHLYVDPDRRLEFRQLIEEGGFVHGFEVQLYRKDGRVAWLSTNARAVRDASGSVLYYEGFLEDITARKQATERLELPNRRLATLNEIARAINLELESPVLLCRALEAIGNALPGTALAVLSYDEKSDTFRMEGLNGLARPIAELRGVKPGDTFATSRLQPTLRVLKKGDCLDLEELLAEMSEGMRRAYERAGIRSALTVGIGRNEEELFGVLWAGRKEPFAFSGEDRRFFRSLAEHLAVALRNAQLLAQVREEAQVNSALLWLETLLGQARGTQAVCEAAVRLIPQLFADSHTYFWLWDRERLRPFPVAAPPELPDALRVEFFHPVVPYERYDDFMEALRTRQLLSVPDAVSDPRVSEAVWREFGIRSFLQVPLLGDDMLLGAMCICRGEVGAFSPHEIELAQGVGQRIVLALQGEQAREDVQQQLARISLLNHIVRAVAERQDLESIFRVMLGQLECHLPIDFGGVLFFDPEARTFTVAARGPRSRPLAAEVGVPEGKVIPVEQSGWRACLKGEVVYMPDLAQVDTPIDRRFAQAGIRSAVGVPLMTEPNLSDRTEKYLELIKTGGEDVAHIVSRMREFYRPRQPQEMLSPVNLNPLVQQVVDLTRPRWKDIPQRQGIVVAVQTDLQEDLPEVMGVESEIREAITNLIFNAVDAMPAGGTVTIRTQAASEEKGSNEGVLPHVILAVSDTGVGMDEETCQLARILPHIGLRKKEVRTPHWNCNPISPRHSLRARAWWISLPLALLPLFVLGAYSWWVALWVLFVVWAATRGPLRALRDLTHAALSPLSTPFSLDREDELGQLARALEQMRARLADSFEELTAAHERERGLKRQLQLLYDSALAISADLSLETVLQQVVDRAGSFVGPDTPPWGWSMPGTGWRSS